MMRRPELRANATAAITNLRPMPRPLKSGVDLGMVDDKLVFASPGVGHPAGFFASPFGFEKAFCFAVILSDFHKWVLRVCD